MIEEHDPDRGETFTRYDGFGEVLTIDDARRGTSRSTTTASGG